MVCKKVKFAFLCIYKESNLVCLHTALNLSLGQSDSFGFFWRINPRLLVLFPLTYVLSSLTDSIRFLQKRHRGMLLGLLGLLLK